MTITIYLPQANEPFGPGWWVNASTDFVGPFETGSHWRVAMTDPEDVDNESFVQIAPIVDNFLVTPFFLNQQVPLTIWPAAYPGRHGASMRLRIQLRGPTDVIESVDIPVTMDLVSGVPYLLQQEIRKQGPISAPTQEQLDAIETAVHMDFPGIGRFGIGQLLPGVPSLSLSRLLITPDRSGVGSLDRQLLLLDVNAFGITWEVVSAPPGQGLIEGAPNRTPRTYLDLRLVGKDTTAHEYTRQADRFNLDNYYLTFNPIGLTRIDYAIEPGTVLRFYWLLWP